ncbi:Asp-tRNA(Asn)/Glu-tRNA(Gln) amidotransferase GatCAB subunit A [Candidatus Kaiserbacteria bacterium CG10_big_fil_rev_8_21_14_0_10_44_10]|uniref:Glutamyl-tRNA(Gln) amidotransferase subunit A n=1 Tax=Candidatus Kaiserbacteria bacterium CG10_big_fil_rev_8_21_14_0_10_44_10 TaxID=1974606 RepID=A0A2H0UIF3_9BACT|nr:MAG: Asp-tRNA(Asn)/Glu-tRNA(Gln) amidotransferase GatCAB subunit A [Candidatus Kaiserbacteria bacterium CG10_big_fil_rev_8_21_14_0_10_44_10]
MKTITQLRQQFIEGSETPVGALADTMKVINEKDKEIHAFLDVYDDAKAVAESATETFSKKDYESKPLLGVPIAVKNNILVKGKKATGASKILENYIASYDATIIKKLKDAGAVIVGSTNLDEFAMGGSTETSAFGPTKNPHDTSRVPGGSSGGSAAAVAMGAVPIAIGTDTGGSIRQPASYCGLVGIKPTYGAVSRFGLMAMGSSLDQAGVLTNSVADAEVILNIMKGQDENDMTTIAPDTYPEVPVKETYTIGVPRSFLKDGIDADVMERFEAHLESLKKDGHKIVDIELPLFEAGLAAYYIVMPAEVSSNLARYDGIRYGVRKEGEDLLDTYLESRAQGFGAEAKRRILLGTYVLSSGYYDAYYGKAEAVRTLMREELSKVFSNVDLVITPTAPTPAFKLGEKEDPLSMYRQDIFTVPVNLTGVPAMSLPMGEVDREGKMLPVGVQYIAPHNGEERLFDIGKKVYDSKK